MFEIVFVPVPKYSTKIRTLSQKQMDLLHSVLFDIVSNVFSSRASGYESEFNRDGDVKITVLGVSPFSNESTQTFVQKISNKLEASGLRELYFIRNVAKKLEPLDVLLAPEVIKKYHYPESLMMAFNLNERNIPEQFVCPITKKIMHDPAYLKSNSKVSYEYTALLTWIIEKNTDPTTREHISAPGIINNDELQKRIYSFVMDMVLNREVEHYFEAERKNTGVQCSLASNVTSLFGVSEKPADSLTLTKLFEGVKLDKELYVLAAKALRRTVHENKTVDSEKLLKEFGRDNIINLQDDNPASGKTALH